ncbi:MAG: VOC family protein [Pseudomonadota bacterium]
MRLDHVHMGCRDRDAMAAWFGSVLGLAPAEAFRVWEQSGGPLILRTSSGGNALALFEGEPPAADSDHTVAFAVDAQAFLALWHLADALGLMHRSGASLRDFGPTDHDGLSWSLYFVSPEGHRIEVTSYDVAAVSEGLR